MMTENILETIRKGVQDFVAPEVRQVKADLGALGSKMDAIDIKFDAKFEALHSEFSALHSEVDSLRSEVRANQQALMAALQNAVLRGEMGTQREISELRERVTRIEDQLRSSRQ
jgi:polyhydroxyalkanoate synthesis regulator phasin